MNRLRGRDISHDIPGPHDGSHPVLTIGNQIEEGFAIML